MAAAMQLGIKTPKASPTHKNISGQIIAAGYNPIKSGPYSRETHETVLSGLDLATGNSKSIPINVKKAHDVLKVDDKYLLLTNHKENTELCVSDFSGNQEYITIDNNIYLTGHGFYDEENEAIIVCGTNLKEKKQGIFLILDPKTFQVIDQVAMNASSPHDIQIYDQDTLAVCDYNHYKKADRPEESYTKSLDSMSNIMLFDRKTLKLKDKIPAYQGAMVSHSIVTEQGDLYAIGFQSYGSEEIETWNNDYIEDKFQTFYETNHPELLGQWPDIAKSIKIHRVEKSTHKFGMPLLPIKMSANSNKANVLDIDNFHHRRAQSICYVRATNTVCMSYPYSDSVHLYNANTDTSRHLNGVDLNLTEMRGICEIENTPYLAIAGIRRGMTIVDTRNLTIVNHYDVSMGRIIHMHHVA